MINEDREKTTKDWGMRFLDLLQQRPFAMLEPERRTEGREEVLEANKLISPFGKAAVNVYLECRVKQQDITVTLILSHQGLLNGEKKLPFLFRIAHIVESGVSNWFLIDVNEGSHRRIDIREAVDKVHSKFNQTLEEMTNVTL